MSKKKDRRIKRLQRIPIWSAVVQMIVTEFIIFSFTVFICLLCLLGIANTLILNAAKESQSVIQYVNENWNKKNREQIESKLSEYVALYDDINGIYIDDKNDVLAVFPKLKKAFDEESQLLLDTVGMIHFIDPEYNVLNFNGILSDKKNEYKQKAVSNSIKLNIKQFIINPRNLFKSMQIGKMLKDREYISWANRERYRLNTISVYRTEIPNLNICFKIIYQLNAFQFNLFLTVLLFFIVVLIVSAIYEIVKVISLVHERKRVNLLVTTDTITGGYNKAYFLQKAQKEISRGRKSYAVVHLRLEKYHRRQKTRYFYYCEQPAVEFFHVKSAPLFPCRTP